MASGTWSDIKLLIIFYNLKLSNIIIEQPINDTVNITLLVNNIGAISISNKIIPKNIIDIIPEFDTVILKLLFSISLLNFTFFKFGKNLLLVLLLAWLTL